MDWIDYRGRVFDKYLVGCGQADESMRKGKTPKDRKCRILSWAYGE